jgi:hypothetical protein
MVASLSLRLYSAAMPRRSPELGRVATHEVEIVDAGQQHEVVGVGELQVVLEPAAVDHEVVEDEGEGLGDGVVAEVAVLEGELRRRVREVLGVPGLVQQCRVVVLAAVWQDDQIDLVGHAHRRAEGPR